MNAVVAKEVCKEINSLDGAGAPALKILRGVNLEVAPGATVAIEGTALETKSGSDGSYSIPNVPAGPQHLLVTAKGFVPARSELSVAQTALTLDHLSGGRFVLGHARRDTLP